jgi:hypothetical protein
MFIYNPFIHLGVFSKPIFAVLEDIAWAALPIFAILEDISSRT